MNGKGDTPRPMQISKKEWDKNFARIFSPAEDDKRSFGCEAIDWQIREIQTGT